MVAPPPSRLEEIEACISSFESHKPTKANPRRKDAVKHLTKDNKALAAIARRYKEEAEATRAEANILFDRVKEQRERAERAEAEVARQRDLLGEWWVPSKDYRRVIKERDAALATVDAVSEDHRRMQDRLNRLIEGHKEARSRAEALRADADFWKGLAKGALDGWTNGDDILTPMISIRTALAGAAEIASPEDLKKFVEEANTPAKPARGKLQCPNCGAQRIYCECCGREPIGVFTGQGPILVGPAPSPPQECEGLWLTGFDNGVKLRLHCHGCPDKCRGCSDCIGPSRSVK